jgi:hypothetical protein
VVGRRGGRCCIRSQGGLKSMPEGQDILNFRSGKSVHSGEINID